MTALHQQFVDAGADIILTNSFGGTRQRLKLHKAEDRVFELAQRAAEIARGVADAAPRPVVVAGSVGPTGELFEPLGALTEEVAVASFTEQIEGLMAGGVDVVWIETMSAVEEVSAAAQAAIDVGVPYAATCSFDTAGRTMMGLMPDALASCSTACRSAGRDRRELRRRRVRHPRHRLVHGRVRPPGAVISKGNCGIPQFQGSEIVYSGTPELMASYATLAADAGARIVGGCCGTSPDHLAAMRQALDGRVAGAAPTVADIVDAIGPLTNAAPTASVPSEGRNRRGRRSTTASPRQQLSRRLE